MITSKLANGERPGLSGFYAFTSLLDGVWRAVNSGSDDNYKEFVSNQKFFQALREYHPDLVKTFLLPTRDRAVRASEIMEVGKVPLDVQILMAGRGAGGQPTARCYQELRNERLQAIVVIPENADPAEYAWFDCRFGWPKFFLSLRYRDTEVGNIELVGVRRNGGTETLVVLISSAAAEALQLSAWRTYEGIGYGKIRITSAE